MKKGIFEVVAKTNESCYNIVRGEIYKVYDIKKSARGNALFLIYTGKDWEYVNASTYFEPVN
jgi:hypothetical protein